MAPLVVGQLDLFEETVEDHCRCIFSNSDGYVQRQSDGWWVHRTCRRPSKLYRDMRLAQNE